MAQSNDKEDPGTIHNVSDTARWVAYYRALESARPDAVFRDPFASRLAGPEGKAIVEALPQGTSWAPALVVRTAVLDEKILARIAAGADLVLNLAAGLDARPWRLPLPPALHWIDVDLPAILHYKTDQLQAEIPKCHYEAIAADLTDAAVRDPLFQRLGATYHHVVVITEGLVIYLEPSDVAALATALHAAAAFQWWLLDLASPELLRIIGRAQGSALRNAPFRFAPSEGAGFFAPFGWQEAEFRSATESARQLR
jgi:methyltransferase (TIGR00027 family)